eukprot:TRINITY_DN3302_c0_g1_i4.p1 TRINITY_DN3302_c0_g1~~TRINITY_DN3302_c0_g1_i4.p1  ORF type:complete len:321 (-),score=93.37 TRINITY_DN3302_c0_g1_i4:166-1128(-)
MAEEEEEEPPSDYSEPKEENPQKSRSSTENRIDDEEEEEIPDYEKQRLSRIRENRARLEALGLPTLASSFLGSVRKHPNTKSKGKKKVSTKKRQQDDEYRPSEGEDGESSSTEEEEEEDNEEGDGSLGTRRSFTRKGKSKSPLNAAKRKKTLPIQRDMNELDLIDDDVSLQQAIALSLGGPPEELPSMLSRFSQDSATSKNDIGRSGRQDGVGVHEATQRRKRRKLNISRVQLTEDELIAYFLSFDVAGKGKITVLDLQRLAEAHDFNWTDKELIDMIDCFDSDRDGKLSLGDFRTIVAQCNMMQGSENVEMGVKVLKDT